MVSRCLRVFLTKEESVDIKGIAPDSSRLEDKIERGGFPRTSWLEMPEDAVEFPKETTDLSSAETQVAAPEDSCGGVSFRRD